MLLPLTSDAQLRYWPVATACLILVNIVAYNIQWSLPQTFVLNRMSAEQLGEIQWEGDESENGEPADEIQDGWFYLQVPGWYPWALSHGQGLHPVQWLTSMFMHGSVSHLLGNMAFLWVFGLVVEGRIGPVLFPIVYIGSGVHHSAICQLLFLWTPAPVALGASAAIYAIMVIAALWAPADNIQALLMFSHLVNIPILILAAAYMLMDFGFAMAGGFRLSTELLHVLGGAVGFAVGLAALSFNLVDCDGQDMLSRIREAGGGKPRPRPQRKKTASEKQEEQKAKADLSSRLQVIDRTLDLHLQAGRIDEAVSLMRQRRQLDPSADWTEPRLISLLALLQKAGRWDEFLHWSGQYLSRFSARKEVLLLAQARIQLEIKHRPGKCLELLKAIDQTRLGQAQQPLFAKLASAARKRIAAGELDFAD